jgi:hypothetical protein
MVLLLLAKLIERPFPDAGMAPPDHDIHEREPNGVLSQIGIFGIASVFALASLRVPLGVVAFSGFRAMPGRRGAFGIVTAVRHDFAARRAGGCADPDAGTCAVRDANQVRVGPRCKSRAAVHNRAHQTGKVRR